MASYSPSSSKASLSSPHRPSHLTPVQIREGCEDKEFSRGRNCSKADPVSESMERRNGDYYDCELSPTLSHSEKSRSEGSSRKRPETDEATGVFGIKFGPSTPLEKSGVQRHSMASPRLMFKSMLASLAPRKSSKALTDGGSAASPVSREKHWKTAVDELSNNLILATKKRNEAILEASGLKHSVAELEKKLNELEIYCNSLKSVLFQYQVQRNSPRVNYQCMEVDGGDKVIEHFLVLVSEARTAVRNLSQVLALQLRHMGVKVYDRISLLLQPYDIKISSSRNPRGLLSYMEALLNRAFFEDFESSGFQGSAPTSILNPIDNCEANFAMFNKLRELTWEEVLDKGTRHFSEDFSMFCDRKMTEIVAMLGRNRAWPEPVLQVFFEASKAVWLVHLLANSVHPSLPIFRVDKRVDFDRVYMEDMGKDDAKELIPTAVRIMVAPGFYVYGNVVKCKVLCEYHNGNGDNSTTASPRLLHGK